MSETRRFLFEMVPETLQRGIRKDIKNVISGGLSQILESFKPYFSKFSLLLGSQILSHGNRLTSKNKVKSNTLLHLDK